MGLLNETEVPELGCVYLMPSSSYDPTDRTGHPVLVVSIDPVRRVAYVVTRTSNAARKGPNGLGHRDDASLGLNRTGWWRLHVLHEVPYLLFAASEDCDRRGPLDRQTWQSVQRRLGERA